MVSLTDDDKTQLGQLTNYLFTRREIIVDHWLAKCAPDEDLHTFTSLSREAFTDQLLVLLHRLIQRLTDESQARDLVERGGQSELHHWQRDYSQAELMLGLDSFYDVLDEQIQQFLELYPQTQVQVITQVYSQLLRLSKEVNKGSITHVDQWRQSGADGQLQTLQAALDSLQHLNRQRTDHLRQTSHDLRSCFSILATAASLLQGPLKAEDREKFMDMMNRNVKAASDHLDQLLAYAHGEIAQTNPVSDKEANQPTPLNES